MQQCVISHRGLTFLVKAWGLWKSTENLKDFIFTGFIDLQRTLRVWMHLGNPSVRKPFKWKSTGWWTRVLAICNASTFPSRLPTLSFLLWYQSPSARPHVVSLKPPACCSLNSPLVHSYGTSDSFPPPLQQVSDPFSNEESQKVNLFFCFHSVFLLLTYLCLLNCDLQLFSHMSPDC